MSFSVNLLANFPHFEFKFCVVQLAHMEATFILSHLLFFNRRITRSCAIVIKILNYRECTTLSSSRTLAFSFPIQCIYFFSR